MYNYLTMLANNTLPEDIELFYSMNYTFEREDPQYGPAKGDS